MNRWITLLCALTLIFSTQAYAGKRAEGAVLGFVGGYFVGKHVEKNKRRPAHRVVVRARSPMEQAFRSQSRFVRKQLQTKLQEKGLYRSYIDGAWGRGTRTAMENFATDSGKTHLLTTESGANELMNILLRPEDGHTSISDSGSSSDMGGGSYMGSSSDTDSMPGDVIDTDDLAETGTDANTDVVVNKTDDGEELAQIKQKLDIVSQQLSLLREVLRVQGKQGGQQNSFHRAEIKVLNKRIAVIEDFQKQTISEAQMRSDSNLRTADYSLGGSSVKASQIYPKIPYYVPGTDEVGVMWIAPRVTNRGVLIYDFNFMEPGGGAENVRETISMPGIDMADIMYGIEKAHEWSDIAQQKGVRQKHEKVAVCFPESVCKDSNGGNATTEVVFMIDPDGSTAAKIQRNTGTAVSSYSFTIESALLLSSYLDYMKKEGEAEYSGGTVTNADLDTMFK